jgi:hypothetical protein
MSFNRNHPSRLVQLRRAVAAVELAVCLPVVVLLVVATIEACSMIFLKQSLSIAAYDGARAAIRAGATATDVRQTCEQILRDRRIHGATITIEPEQFEHLEPGQYVDVILSAPCGSNTVVPNTFYRDKTISARASMMIEFRQLSP